MAAIQITLCMWMVHIMFMHAQGRACVSVARLQLRTANVRLVANEAGRRLTTGCTFVFSIHSGHEGGCNCLAPPRELQAKCQGQQSHQGCYPLPYHQC